MWITLPGHVIVEILKEDHDRKFFKEVKMAGGETRLLTITLEADKLYDDHFSQGVSMARAYSVGEGVPEINEGDLLIIDYTIDTGKAKIISNENGVKLVRASGVNEFYTEDKLIPAGKDDYFDNYEYRVGDLKSAATVFGVVNGNEIRPLKHYVILKYVKIDGNFEETESGLVLPSTAGDLVLREVLFAHPESSLSSGDIILVDYFGVYERDLLGETISICMESDILGIYK